jgi:GNAT superfamily N-acetyltransferase
MELAVAPFDVQAADERALRESFVLRADAAALDRPEDPPLSYDAVIGRLRAPLTAQRAVSYWVARYEGRIIGLASVAVPSSPENPVGQVEITVHPRWRRRGVATTLLRAVLPVFVEVHLTAVEVAVRTGEPGEHWAAALGFTLVHETVLQQLLFAGTDPPGEQAATPPPGYQLRTWTGSAPEDLLASYAAARNAITDAPQGESSEVEPRWTPERVREAEHDVREREGTQRVVVAVHEGSGQVAALTELDVYAYRQQVGYQADTVVVGEHRGHGLGRCIKSHMLRRLRSEQPDLERIYTSCAASNVHMLRINRDLGFQAFAGVLVFEQTITALESTLRNRPHRHPAPNT